MEFIPVYQVLLGRGRDAAYIMVHDVTVPPLRLANSGCRAVAGRPTAVS
jgi:hypothetical protein